MILTIIKAALIDIRHDEILLVQLVIQLFLHSVWSYGTLSFNLSKKSPFIDGSDEDSEDESNVEDTLSINNQFKSGQSLNNELDWHNCCLNSSSSVPLGNINNLSNSSFELMSIWKSPFNHYLKVKKGLTNLTTKSGSRVRLKCEFKSNPSKVKINWFKNEASIEVKKAKIKIKSKLSTNGKVSSILRLDKVDIHDSGFYKCEADNGFQTLDSFGVVKVIESGHFGPPFTSFHLVNNLFSHLLTKKKKRDHLTHLVKTAGSHSVEDVVHFCAKLTTQSKSFEMSFPSF